ncbi:MAG: 4Fe-4S dicluster domain-containing protein [Proteobacteria bacterium]|nr:4Fe-4S dicluster domain-containing protein [Pseudomonadota bacterium]
MASEYQRFIDHLAAWAPRLPDSKVLAELIQTRLSPAEAGFLAQVPFLPHTIEQLAEKFGVPPAEVAARLDPLAEKGLVFRHQSAQTVRYALNDSLFDFYRSPFWAGAKDEQTSKLAVLANRYFDDGYGREFGAYPTMGLRAIPVHRTVKDPRQVMPYEDIIAVLDQEDLFCTSTCPCRHRKNLDPDTPDCEHETFNCLHFGRLAGYMVKQDMGQKITRQETLDIIEQAANAGLVHGVSNTKFGMDTICNCCSCCCMFLESYHVLGLHGHQPSNYILAIETGSCAGCETCVERCPMKALTMTEDGPRLAAERCLGCGVCVHTCPTASLILAPREAEQDFCENFRDMAGRMAGERGLKLF